MRRIQHRSIYQMRTITDRISCCANPNPSAGPCTFWMCITDLLWPSSTWPHFEIGRHNGASATRVSTHRPRLSSIHTCIYISIYTCTVKLHRGCYANMHVELCICNVTCLFYSQSMQLDIVAEPMVCWIYSACVCNSAPLLPIASKPICIDWRLLYMRLASRVHQEQPNAFMWIIDRRFTVIKSKWLIRVEDIRLSDEHFILRVLHKEECKIKLIVMEEKSIWYFVPSFSVHITHRKGVHRHCHFPATMCNPLGANRESLSRPPQISNTTEIRTAKQLTT